MLRRIKSLQKYVKTGSCRRIFRHLPEFDTFDVIPAYFMLITIRTLYTACRKTATFVLICTIVFCMGATVCIAQQSVPIKRMAAGFAYEEIVTGNKTGKQLPLLIAFHYSSGTPEESFKDYNALGTPARIIVVKGNYIKRGGYSYFPVDYYAKDSTAQINIARQTTDSIATFIAQISKLYKTKPVVSGISQGGDISFLLAIYHPDLVKASFPFAAVMRPQILDIVKAKPGNTLPIFVYQGEVDKIIDVNNTRTQVSKLSRYLKISLKTYPGLGHDISSEMKKDYSPLIRQWLLRN
jgi:phospholipase/carboxylesterase